RCVRSPTAARTTSSHSARAAGSSRTAGPAAGASAWGAAGASAAASTRARTSMGSPWVVSLRGAAERGYDPRTRARGLPLDSHSTDTAEPLWVLAGPTASGKTALSLALAERLGCELCSMDSMLVYRGLDVGTAKPTAAERARVPHHGIDLVEPEAAFGVPDWLAAAEAALADARARGVRLVFVG